MSDIIIIFIHATLTRNNTTYQLSKVYNLAWCVVCGALCDLILFGINLYRHVLERTKSFVTFKKKLLASAMTGTPFVSSRERLKTISTSLISSFMVATNSSKSISRSKGPGSVHQRQIVARFARTFSYFANPGI